MIIIGWLWNGLERTKIMRGYKLCMLRYIGILQVLIFVWLLFSFFSLLLCFDCYFFFLSSFLSFFFSFFFLSFFFLFFFLSSNVLKSQQVGRWLRDYFIQTLCSVNCSDYCELCTMVCDINGFIGPLLWTLQDGLWHKWFHWSVAVNFAGWFVT